MNPFKIQEELFELIRIRCKDQKHWVDEIAEVLSLSKPAIYKRISGNTSLSLGDLAVLMKEYDISFDSLIHENKTAVAFSFSNFDNQIKSFMDFLSPVKQMVEGLSRFPKVELWHATSELHLFYYFFNEPLTNFKMFLHAKTVWNLEGYNKQKFSLNDFSGASLIRQETGIILDHYLTAPNVELWSESILNKTLNQIKYFFISDYFQQPQDAFLLCESLRTLLHHLMKMAETGKKFKPGSAPGPESSDYHLYHNELSYTNNLILVLSEHKNMVLTTYNNPNYMVTENKRLVDYTKNWFLKVKRMSQPLSLDASQSRMMLFKQIEKKIDLTVKELEFLMERMG